MTPDARTFSGNEQGASRLAFNNPAIGSVDRYARKCRDANWTALAGRDNSDRPVLVFLHVFPSGQFTQERRDAVALKIMVEGVNKKAIEKWSYSLRRDTPPQHSAVCGDSTGTP